MSAMAKPDKGLGPLGLFHYFRRNEIILNHAEAQGPQGPQSSHFPARLSYLPMYLIATGALGGLGLLLLQRFGARS